MSSREETLRLQFGTAANAIGAQLHAVEQANGGNGGLRRSDGKPRLLAFEAKDRIHRKVSAKTAINREQIRDSSSSWTGGIQVYDQAPETAALPDSALPSTAYWSWDQFSDKNLVEIEEFRPYMPLHNFYEGQPTSRDGSLATLTMENIEDRLRGVLEECDNVRFVQNIVDMDSSWAGLSNEVLTYLTEECPSAVIATFGNDWRYPLSDQSDVNLYAASTESRDKSKIEARRGINLITSVAAFVESSSIFIPVALSGASRRYTIDGSMPELLGAASFAATAIQIAMSEFRSTNAASAYSLVEGIIPSMNVVELAAQFPLTQNPCALIDESSSLSETETLKWNQHSLLPQSTPQRLRGAFSSSTVYSTPSPARFRRLHFVGDFDGYALRLQSSIDGFLPQNCVAHWTREPLRVATADSLAAVSQLSLSRSIGSFLRHVATQTSHKRVLYEFTQAGMSVDALEELQASLRSMGDAYESAATVDDDADDSVSDE